MLPVSLSCSVETSYFFDQYSSSEFALIWEISLLRLSIFTLVSMVNSFKELQLLNWLNDIRGVYKGINLLLTYDYLCVNLMLSDGVGPGWDPCPCWCCHRQGDEAMGVYFVKCKLANYVHVTSIAGCW